MTARLTQKQFRALDAKQPKRSKYGAKPVTIDGIRFDSKKEGNRWLELRALEQQGLISNLERQPEFSLKAGDRPVLIKSKGYPNGRQVKYRADFAYWDGDKRVIEDCKGFRTKEFILKKAFVEAQFPAIRIVEV